MNTPSCLLVWCRFDRQLSGLCQQLPSVPEGSEDSGQFTKSRSVCGALHRPTHPRSGTGWSHFFYRLQTLLSSFSVTCAVTVWFMFRICVRKGEMCWQRSWDTWWIKRCSPRQLPLKRLCCGWTWGHTHTSWQINVYTFTRWCWIFLILCLFLRRFWVRQRETQVVWSWRSTRGEKNTEVS